MYLVPKNLSKVVVLARKMAAEAVIVDLVVDKTAALAVMTGVLVEMIAAHVGMIAAHAATTVAPQLPSTPVRWIVSMPPLKATSAKRVKVKLTLSHRLKNKCHA